LTRVTFWSAKSWADFMTHQDQWLKPVNQSAVILTPKNWKSLTIPFFPAPLCFPSAELLTRYLTCKYGPTQLLAKHALTNLLLSIIFDTTAEKNRLSIRYFNIETYYQGYARALTEFILNFRENGTESLLDTLYAFKKEKLSLKEQDLIKVHDELENLLEEQQLFDYRRAVFDLVSDKVKGNPSFYLPELPDATLVIFGFTHLNPLDSKLIGYLMYRFPRSIFAYCQNQPAAPATFAGQISIENFIEKARQVFGNALTSRELEAGTTPSFMPLAELLFRDDKTSALSPTSLQVSTQIENDRFNEVTQIARQIRELKEAGIPYDKIRIIFPQWEKYAALLIEIFPRYQIPYLATFGTPLKFYPLAQLIFNILNYTIVPTPYLLRDHIFTSPYVTFSQSVSASDLQLYLEKIGDEFQEVIQIIHNRLPAPENFHLNYSRLQILLKKATQAVQPTESWPPVKLIIHYLKQFYLNDPAAFASTVFEAVVNQYLLSRAERALYVWRKELDAASFQNGFEKLMQRFHIAENIQLPDVGNDSVLSSIVKQDRRVFTHLRQLIEQLVGQFSVLEKSKKLKFSISDYLNALNSLTEAPENALPAIPVRGVTVFAPTDPPLQFWPVTFIGGLIDGDLPEQEQFNFLQPKSEDQLLGSEMTFVARDRQILYQIIATTTDRLILTSPLTEGGKKLLVSPFLSAVQKCFAEELPRATGDVRTLYNRREQLIYLARRVDYVYERALPVLLEVQKRDADYFAQVIKIFECDGRRASIENFSQYDGLFENESARNIISAQLGSPVKFTVEQLDRFAGCPLRFLLDDLMQLKSDTAFDYHPDHTRRGQLIHTILTEFSNKIAPAHEITEEAPAILKNIATTALAELLNEKEDLFNQRFQYNLLAGLEPTPTTTTKRPGLLASFLNFELTAPDLLTPYLGQLTFNNATTDSPHFEIFGIPIDLTIDRVDCTESGNYLIIYNYTVAELEDVEAIGKGLRFKLPLQILALRHYLAEQKNPLEVGGAGTYLVKNFRQIRRGGYFAMTELQASRQDRISDQHPLFSGQRKYGFLPAPNFEAELTTVKKRVRTIKGLVTAGRFHLPLCTVKDQICANCHFVRICRKEQLRLDKLYVQLAETDVYKPLRRIET